ncbi:MAG: hypothetical protein E7635_03360 [Ruminococcaceae bacterium]|nr:hypothetical protein [Oscillospiraceae bacterium]
MNNYCENKLKNSNLKKIYRENTDKYLKVWREYYSFKSPERINEFGIIDVYSYDDEKGVLFIAKETNGWDYSDGKTFRSWVEEMAKDNKVTGEIASRHPQIWYNLGRWAKFIFDPKLDKAKLAQEKNVSGLKNIAITNLNKAEGESTSGKAFWKLIKEDVVINLLREEIKEINPKLIVLCGIPSMYIQQAILNLDGEIKIIEMPHPSARTISKLDMLAQLKRNLKMVGWNANDTKTF